MTMEVNDEESCQNGSMHPDIPFEFGSGRSGHVVPKQESECVEEAGEDEACYEEFNFAKFNSDIYSIPDKDPLSMDGVSHVGMKQEVATELGSTNVPVSPSDEMEDIETTMHENESQLQASNIRVKIEFVGNPVDDSSLEVATDSSGHSSSNQRKVELKTWLCSLCNTGFPSEKLYWIHVKALHAGERSPPRVGFEENHFIFDGWQFNGLCNTCSRPRPNNFIYCKYFAINAHKRSLLLLLVCGICNQRFRKLKTLR
ncbi:unnamed protein product [Orchesella dallaii]|uniref:C2H2-type domain-containing protein n=1 Tax=Orchesella dallaii TaxID=48710 RepID=A0ABP1QTM8_9HEXA